jgi:hypothetical protein
MAIKKAGIEGIVCRLQLHNSDIVKFRYVDVGWARFPCPRVTHQPTPNPSIYGTRAIGLLSTSNLRFNWKFPYKWSELSLVNDHAWAKNAVVLLHSAFPHIHVGEKRAHPMHLLPSSTIGRQNSANGGNKTIL